MTENPHGIVLRNLSTKDNRAFWESVEKTALECRAGRQYHICCPIACSMGDGEQTCAEVMIEAQEAKEEKGGMNKTNIYLVEVDGERSKVAVVANSIAQTLEAFLKVYGDGYKDSVLSVSKFEARVIVA